MWTTLSGARCPRFEASNSWHASARLVKAASLLFCAEASNLAITVRGSELCFFAISAPFSIPPEFRKSRIRQMCLARDSLPLFGHRLFGGKTSLTSHGWKALIVRLKVEQVFRNLSP
jgi:hypothetical protein